MAEMTVDGVRLVVAGAGLRGIGYARRAAAGGTARVVAVAEPDPARRAAFAAEFGVPADQVFAGWADLAAAGRLGDAAVIATQDRMHADAAVAFAGLGYHILLEKPMATTEPDALRIAAAVDAAGVMLAVCHVLRYTPYTRALKGLLDGDAIGKLVNVQHLEPIGWWHFAHSFVRGHWNNSETSAPLLLTKSCHDIDWLLYLIGAAPSRVSSFGGLAHFRPEQRPAEAADNCLDCPLERSCPYSAPRLYRSCLGDPAREFWPLSAVTTDHTEAGIDAALRTGPYGRCVYGSDNNVVDHQVVAMEFPDGATCTFTMTAFTPMEHRRTRLFGTHGYVDGDGRLLHVTDFRTGEQHTIDTGTLDGDSAGDGHGGGDDAIMDAFLKAVACGDASALHSDAAASLASHRVVWAAEQARTTGTVTGGVPTPA
ncbi:Gfo/Idh/MocA family oxidoreductase [Catellatospora chokoriensis]|uniref:Oxidoreductase n=2 Tax=Catellatospora chokoriensis TaxID=310353 RepID=A0A8J3K042_9ACTN|nr:oxidoreductase [Catellatospora chokoriensis]